MSHALAIQQLLDLAVADSGTDDDTAIKHLIASGVPEKTADDAVRFTGIAFARLFLRELGVELSDQYITFRANGSVAQSGELSKNESFRAASELAPNFVNHAGFKLLAHASPEFDAVNQALNAGSDPKDLVMGPVAIFLEQPTRQGFEAAQRQIMKLAQAAAGSLPQQSGEPAKSPWWKFW